MPLSRYQIRNFLLSFVTLALVAACQEEKGFNGEISTNKTTENDTELTNLEADTELDIKTESEAQTKSCDFSKDKIDIEYPDYMQNCVDGGGLWDFSANRCSKVRQATSFKCSFSGIVKKAKSLGIDARSKINYLRNQNAKLISCGEVPGKDIILMQGWFADEKKEDCALTADMMIFTGCLRIWKGNARNFQNQSEDQQIAECLRDANRR